MHLSAGSLSDLARPIRTIAARAGGRYPARPPRVSSRGRAVPLLFLALVLAGAAGLAAPAWGFTNDDCMQCHSDSTLTMPGPNGREISLWVDLERYDSSAHAGFGCIDCHGEIADLPHEEDLPPVDCSTCHGDVQEVFARSTHGKGLVEGVEHSPHCYDCHGKHDIRSASDDQSMTSHFRLVETCARCHADPEVVEKLPFGNRAPVDGYLRSVHGKALLEKQDPNAPTCGTCHPPHEVLPPSDPASLVNPVNLPLTCAQCHADIHEVYAESVHGVAVARGKRGAPTCADCHGEHLIASPHGEGSGPFPASLARTTCPSCHASEVMGSRYGFDATRVASFGQTYHGLATRRGDLSAANCASCHGVHNIFPSNDARSTVHPDNLVSTCGDCHPDANTRFASISVHPSIGGDRTGPRPPAETVKWVYILLLLTVIGGMAAHNGIIWWYYVMQKVRRERRLHSVRRFTRLEAVAHQLNLIAFFVLVFTGFALKFPDAGWARLAERVGMTEEMRALTHRVMAVLMIAIALLHTGYLIFTRRGRRDLLGIMPTLRDVQDFVHNMSYHLGIRKDRPLFPRFDYTEKAEYLALIWGTSVMILTGLILWFPTVATRYLPAWSFPVAEVIHYYEAWLAFLAILVWHLFFVIFHPDVYPINLTFLKGRTTVEHAMHRHGSIEAATGETSPEILGAPGDLAATPPERHHE